MIRLLILVALSLLPATSLARAAEVTVLAAASLGDVLDEVAAAFEQETGHDVVLSVAGSSVLARQIERGAPADVFISANVAWFRHLADAGVLDPDSRVDVAGNRLVVIGASGSGPLDLTDHDAVDRALGDGRLAMALVEAVPAGIYGKAALGHLGLWDLVAARVAQADNVRAALAFVATGAAPLGVVYATDALAEPRVSIRAEFPAGSHMKITYPAALVAKNANPAAQEFLAFLTGPAAKAAFSAAGFEG